MPFSIPTIAEDTYYNYMIIWYSLIKFLVPEFRVTDLTGNRYSIQELMT